MFELLGQSLANLPGYLIDANKRIFSLYLLSALVFALLVFFHQRLQKGKSASASQPKALSQGWLHYLLNPKIWWHPSARLDYLLFVINPLLKALLWAPMVLTMVPIALGFSSLLETLFGVLQPISDTPWVVMLSFTLLLFLFDDFSRFVLHLALHKVPILWAFHRVHHSARVLTPMTIYRSHPLESYLYACRMAVAQGCAVGLGYYLFGNQLKMLDLLGANIFVFAFNIMGSNLRHSHVRWAWGDAIEKWFVSPAQHQIHHSDRPIHFDKNLGSALAVWDRLFGTLVLSSSAKRIRFGLGRGQAAHTSLLAIYWQPVQQAVAMLWPNKPQALEKLDHSDE